jgi:hypothetical protein
VSQWRSILSVPANVDRSGDGSHRRRIQLDLKGGIPSSEKEDARRRLPMAIARVSQGGRGQYECCNAVRKSTDSAFVGSFDLSHEFFYILVGVDGILVRFSAKFVSS